MQSQVYILIAAAAVMFLIIGGLSLLAHYYTLNGIKSRTVGDGQHGTAGWWHPLHGDPSHRKCVPHLAVAGGL